MTDEPCNTEAAPVVVTCKSSGVAATSPCSSWLFVEPPVLPLNPTLMFAGGLMYTIDHSYCADCHTIDNHEGQEAYSQTDSSCSLPDLWRGTRRKVPTHHGTPTYTAAS